MKKKDLYKGLTEGGYMKEAIEPTLFTRVVGNSAWMRILDTLITNREIDYSLGGIVEGAQVSWTTVQDVVPQLASFGLIKYTRNIGKAKMYQINSENYAAHYLIELYDELMRRTPISGEATSKEVHEVHERVYR